MYKVRHHGYGFSWDEAKNRANRRKHGISFEEALTAFDDTHALGSYDPGHSEDEDRYYLIGMTTRLRILLICHCYREDETTIRIISARKANGQETQAYQR